MFSKFPKITKGLSFQRKGRACGFLILQLHIGEVEGMGTVNHRVAHTRLQFKRSPQKLFQAYGLSGKLYIDCVSGINPFDTCSVVL